ncbi:hypothetical protein BpHYR1_011741 [Brachionus plicatilis]|uniref:Uncharacterized protein n=1 Tax=Brachionus plicatilis TaxID=10195 RepID=A0A3M7P8C5_BRAPC|nr:hypothetical protein BpHYR1_011741 [Brachionus plicatilis]
MYTCLRIPIEFCKDLFLPCAKDVRILSWKFLYASNRFIQRKTQTEFFLIQTNLIQPFLT